MVPLKKGSHRHSDILMEVLFTQEKWPCPTGMKLHSCIRPVSDRIPSVPALLLSVVSVANFFTVKQMGCKNNDMSEQLSILPLNFLINLI